jgi:hypothetical protein
MKTPILVDLALSYMLSALTVNIAVLWEWG